MKKAGKILKISSGSPQFRIQAVFDHVAPLYFFYGQNEIDNDLVGLNIDKSERKSVRTFDQVITVSEGDVVFSLVSGQATLVRKIHEGYLLTQNYVKINLNEQLDNKYLTYILNEDDNIKKQLKLGLQGSQVLKYTLKQIREIDMPAIPALSMQRLIGDVYFNQIHLQALKKQTADLETVSTLEKLKRIDKNERIEI
ncbi:restriction endonuclease subunit M [Leuconostoc sp. MS02]|uniref:Restriction endonuclease subunit M n=1 Tax=Leuconostoc aquikimchii TaxID=3236804 RepID=A0ABV3S5D8_9LACO